MKTAPFDLELAKLGHPLVTRNGLRVLEFHYFNTVTSNYPISYVINTGGTIECTIEGAYRKDCKGGEDLFLDLSTPWEKPLQQGEEIMCQGLTPPWIPCTFICQDGHSVVVRSEAGHLHSYTTWKRPDPVARTSKIDITLDVKINGKDMSKEDKNKFMDYLKKFVNEVL